MSSWVHEAVKRFLDEHPDHVQVVLDTGGEGLCIDFSEDLVRWVAKHYPESGVVDGDAEGGLIAEIDLTTRKGHVTIPDEYPTIEDPEGRMWGIHNVAWIPDDVSHEVGYCVDLTARQFDETLPFPFIWRSSPPPWILEYNEGRKESV